MNGKKLLEYIAPKIEVFYLEMEEGIASTSANITISSGTNANTPDVEDWRESTTTTIDYL
ncbi:hypothetical protein [Sphingobacterium hungaricum]